MPEPWRYRQSTCLGAGCNGRLATHTERPFGHSGMGHIVPGS